MTNLSLTADEDRELRAFARALSPDDGEDAYHNAILQILAHPPAYQVENPRGFYRTAIKRAVYKLYRHDSREREHIALYLAGRPPKHYAGLAFGRFPRTHCRRGHLFTPDTIKMVGARRTCRICYRVTDALLHKRNYSRSRKESPHA